MEATAKFHVKYNGVWYAKGDVIDVADADKFDMAEYCDFGDRFAPETVAISGDEIGTDDESPRRGRRKKN